ncbi:MAG TPA: hypothetical protein VEN82_00840 [Actinomycetota bacterium]|nr:hypothetical protein [Actinomycetota bacterium]
MVRRALAPGLAATLLASVIGAVAGGPGVAVSASLGIAVAVGGFCAGLLALDWAAGVSLAAVQAVTLAGFVVRVGIVVGMMAGLQLTSWFSVVAFGLAVAPGFLALSCYEGVLVMRGLGQTLVIPPEPAAQRSDALGAEERP